MEYKSFTKIIKRGGCKEIDALSIPESCSMTRIPDEFGLLLPNVLKILHDNLYDLCDKEEEINIIGMQVSFTPIISDLPRILDRVVDPKHHDWHFCCSLNYLVVRKVGDQKVKSWENAKSVIIDFTTGVVMDPNKYLSFVLNQEKGGTIYGYLDSSLLNKIWNLINIKG